MVHRLVIVLSVVIVFATPAVLIGNAAWLLMQPWFIEMVTLGLAMALGFDRMFSALHSLTFDGESWRFADEYTVRQLFPDAFWIVAGVVLTALVLAQASTILAVLRDRRPAHTAKRIVS